MANTTFTGAVRSKGGFTTISENSIGAITTLSSISSTGVSSFDANTMVYAQQVVLTSLVSTAQHLFVTLVKLLLQKTALS